MSFGLAVLTHEYAVYGLNTNPGKLPWAEVMAWPQSWLWVPGAVLILVLVPLYFPDGRLVSRRWSSLVWATIAFSIIGAVVSALEPGEIQGSGVRNPFGVEDLHPVIRIPGQLVPPLWFVILFASAVSLVVRFRRSAGEERQQIKWLAFAALLVPCWFLISPSVEAVSLSAFVVLDSLAFAGIPIAVGIALLRYRLYDIDLIINRTLVYVTLTACIIGTYVLLVAYTSAIVGEESNLLISVIATAIVAAAFAPVRERVQRGVNRLMYGERNDPYAVLSRLGDQMKLTTAPESVLQAIVDTVAGSLKVPYAAISLYENDSLRTVATHGVPAPGSSLVLPLTYGTQTLGEMSMSPRAPGEPLDALDRRLLGDLARQAESAAYALLLTTDLRHSRGRLVTAREEERRRLRRDLHDGLGPQLAALTLKVEAARYLVSPVSEDASTLLEEIRSLTRSAIADIRRLVYELRPSALDQLGLVSAIQEQATSLGQGGLAISVDAAESAITLPAAVEVAAYRIVQEALTNVVRHASASCCSVSLKLEPGVGLDLEVVDDGVGLHDNHRSGVGITSMQERAAELGGNCRVEQLDQSGGTRVRAWLPLPMDGNGQ